MHRDNRASAQNYIEKLPEREWQQEEAWGRVAQEYSTGVEEINAQTLIQRSSIRSADKGH
jgi:hypothetical protein